MNPAWQNKLVGALAHQTGHIRFDLLSRQSRGEEANRLVWRHGGCLVCLVCRQFQVAGLAFFNRKLQQSGTAVEAMSHFSVGNRQEERHHAAEMDA